MDTNRHQTHCSDCSLNPICLPTAVNNDQLTKLDDMIKRGRPVRRGEHIFRAADDFVSVFAVRSGAFKTYSLTEDGEEQVTGFYLPGEIFGMDGLSTNHHINSAKALDSASACEIPFNRLEELSTEIPSLQRHFFQLMSKEIQSDQKMMLLLSKKPAEERVAAFLLSLSARHARRGLDANVFRLPMSRNDIGNYLGLAVETVSRVFTRFQQQGMLKANGKDIEVIDRTSLCSLSGPGSSEESMVRFK